MQALAEPMACSVPHLMVSGLPVRMAAQKPLFWLR
jgi:hypothetical protein